MLSDEEYRELSRPDWCPDQSCKVLTSYDNNICTGRLKKLQRHKPLKNTHSLCEGTNYRWFINKADALYYILALVEVIDDVDKNKLYDPKQDGLNYGPAKINIEVK